ncbi:MAG: cob(I)yrinic acid a,c-diamide adenosyltransferase [Alphaproteobacteria bacterium]
MVRLTRIYTRGGDKGKTSLGDGARVAKHDLRVEAYGTVDEANAAVGLARQHTQGEADRMLRRIQDDLFDLGADLCFPEKPKAPRKAAKGERLRIVESQVRRLEQEIDNMNAELQPLDSFVLPGGSPAAAYLHFARTVVRRAERLLARLAEDESVNPFALQYLNRLSDHLFVLARFLNDRGRADVLWRPGANR